MNPQHFVKIFKNFGLTALCIDIVCRLWARWTGGFLLRAVKIEPFDIAQKAPTQLPPGLTWRILNNEELPFLLDVFPDEITPSFIARVLQKRDLCLAIFDGETIVSFGWYSHEPTEINDDFTISFDQRYTYMYKGYTAPLYRGLRLHALGMMLALEFFTGRGSRGLVSYVEENNFPSLRSCYRLGYKPAGLMWAGTIAGRRFTGRTTGCRTYGLSIVTPRDTAPSVECGKRAASL